MKGKERSHQGAAPKRARQALKQSEEQEGVGGVKEQAGDVMAEGLQPVKLAVQHVRQPRQRMPIRSVSARESPPHALPPQSRLHPWIVGEVIRIVESHE